MNVRCPPAPNTPRRARVRAHASSPIEVEGERVEMVLEDWLVEDRWWTEQPIRRRYWEVVTVTGRRLVVFHDLQTHEWLTQAA